MNVIYDQHLLFQIHKFTKKLVRLMITAIKGFLEKPEIHAHEKKDFFWVKKMMPTPIHVYYIYSQRNLRDAENTK